MEKKTVGSPKTRRAIKSATKRILFYVKRFTPTEAAIHLGIGVDDVRNMRAGNQLSVPILVKLVRFGWDAELMLSNGFRLTDFGNTRISQLAINRRITKLAKQAPGKAIAKAAGMSVTGAYGLRYTPDANKSLHTVLAFAAMPGQSIDSILFGGK